MRTPRISNFTDVDALAAEPGVLVRFAASPAELADADLVILPGTRATVADLAWLRERGLAAAVAERARRGPAGARHLRRLPDARPRRSTTRSSPGPGVVAGLGLLPARVAFGPDKVLGQAARHRRTAAAVTGYEIHHGVVRGRPGGRGPVPGRLPVRRRVGHDLARRRWSATTSGGRS